ncbi:hypothetical protein [Paractinoplanes maris]|uniref:hypothetical protein n=1 Tax=Paractinoplanes maris TaxID=1734446 RepID=UPI003F68F17F
MPTVDISAADYAQFSSAASAAGLTVGQWLTGIGRARTLGGLDELWAATLRDLAGEVTSNQEQTYLRAARLTAIVEGVALVAVPDAFTRDVLEARLRPAIVEALRRRLGVPVQLAVRVDEQAAPQAGGPPVADDVQRYAEMLSRPEVAQQLAAVLAAARR